jgi:hypothetical protein
MSDFSEMADAIMKMPPNEEPRNRSTGVFVVRFKREENSLWEWGIAINDHALDSADVTIIVDRDRKVVEGPIWNFNAYLGEGCINFML